jgi:hypothetical protein
MPCHVLIYHCTLSKRTFLFSFFYSLTHLHIYYSLFSTNLYFSVHAGLIKRGDLLLSYLGVRPQCHALPCLFYLSVGLPARS